MNFALLPNFITYYENELIEARRDVVISGGVEKQLRDLPGITEHRFNQLQEVEAMLNYMNVQLRKVRHKHYKQFLEGYARALTSSDAKIYSDAEDEVIDYEVLINEVALVRNRFLGILKGIDNKQWQLSNLVRLRTAGLENIEV